MLEQSLETEANDRNWNLEMLFFLLLSEQLRGETSDISCSSVSQV